MFWISQVVVLRLSRKYSIHYRVDLAHMIKASAMTVVQYKKTSQKNFLFGPHKITSIKRVTASNFKKKKQTPNPCLFNSPVTNHKNFMESYNQDI